MATFYAKPYDLDLEGFYFEDMIEYVDGVAEMQRRYRGNDYEHSIQYIDGDDGETALANLLSGKGEMSPSTLEDFYEIIDRLGHQDEFEAYCLFIDSSGGDFDTVGFRGAEDAFVGQMSVEDYAYGYVQDQGVPDHLQSYIDYKELAHDLAHDFHVIETRDGSEWLFRAY